MKYRGIVFDKDGTLLDFQRSWLPVYRIAALDLAQGDEALALALLEANGYDDRAQRIVGGSLLAVASNHQVAAAWARQLERENATATLAARLEEILRVEGSRCVVAVDGLAETLHRLKREGYRLGIATSDSRRGIDNTLAGFDVLEQFDFLAGYDSGYGVKPGGGMVRAFCAQTSLEVGAVIVVGDNEHDIAMGRDADAGLCVGVLTGTGTREQLQGVADVVLDDIGELADYLAGLSGR